MNNIDFAFRIVCSILKVSGIPFWLEAGSMLGAAREGKRIEWDNDYDIAYPIQYAPDVLEALQVLKTSLIPYDTHGNLYHSISFKGKHLICIQPHKVIDNHMWRVRSILSTEYHITKLPFCLQKLILRFQMKVNRKMYNRGHKENYNYMIKVKMGEEMVFIPSAFDYLLTKKYGDWRVPHAN